MNDSEKDDPVWKLLAAAPKATPSSFFSRNVVREVRLLSEKNQGSGQGAGSWIANLLRHPAVSLAGGVAALVLLFFVFSAKENPGTAPIAQSPSGTGPAVEASKFDPAGEFESIEYLGHLMTVENPADLDDEMLADLVLLAGR